MVITQKKAADLEYSSLVENETWDLVRLPKGHTIIGCKWIFRVKYDGEGNIMLNVLKADLLHRVSHRNMELIISRFFHQLHVLPQFRSFLLLQQRISC